MRHIGSKALKNNYVRNNVNDESSRDCCYRHSTDGRNSLAYWKTFINSREASGLHFSPCISLTYGFEQPLFIFWNGLIGGESFEGL